MAKTLELQFVNQLGKLVKITIDNPKEPINPAAVSAAMDNILMANVFTSSGGDLVEKKGARLVDHNVSDIAIV
jgi:hypothetical protein